MNDEQVLAQEQVMNILLKTEVDLLNSAMRTQKERDFSSAKIYINAADKVHAAVELLEGGETA